MSATFRRLLAVAMLVVAGACRFLVAGCGGPAPAPSSEGEKLLGRANDLHDRTMYAKAEGEYRRAASLAGPASAF